MSVDCSTSMLTETYVCKHELHATWHAVRFFAASLAWTVGSKRPAYIKLTEVIGEPAAGAMPKRRWDTLEVKPHYWFNQLGHGNLRNYASKSRAKLHAANMRAVSSPHLSHGQSEASDQQRSN